MGRRRKPAWKEETNLPLLCRKAKLTRNLEDSWDQETKLSAQQASATWADETKLTDVLCTLLFW